jgi:hypothetical protein
MNANNWYNKSPQYNKVPVARPFSNFNQWAAAVGGPILKNKLFFFVNTEGITFITSSQSVVHFPSTTYASDPSWTAANGNTSVLGNDSNCDNLSSTLFVNGFNNECSFYKTIFKLYEGAPNYKNATSTGTAGQLQLSVPSKFALTEKLITGRVDANLSGSDKVFGHFKYDQGMQPTYTDPINSAFDAQSNQPDYEGQFAETHSFGTKAANQFLATGSYYSAIFVNKNPATELATFPMQLRWYDGFANDLNNDALAWPEGRNVAQYQVGDDFSVTVGKHTLKAGVSFKKDDVSDFDTGVLNTPLVFTDSAYGDFESGQSLLGVQNFPTSLDLPLSLYTLGLYFEDNWKPMPKMTVTAGVRVERNSNVSCRKNCLSNFGGNFFTLAASAPLDSLSGAYNKQIAYDLPDAFTKYQRFMVEPRAGFTFSPTTKTVVRGGAGFFTDVFPGTIADTMLDNPPLNVEFQILGSSFGGPTMPLQPSVSGSYQSLAAGANATFQSGFKSGGSFNSMSAANPNFSAPSFTTVEGSLHYPTYEEWNLQIQHQFTRSDSIQIGYVGNHGYHEPNENVGVNAVGGYGLPAATPSAPSFGPVTEVESEASSNYNGLIVSYLRQGHGLNLQLNYAWSHALDEISNGGILPFNSGSIDVQVNPHSLRQNYGNADYDIPQTFSGTYLYQMPYFGGPKVVTQGWQVGGTIFYNDGSPFTPSAYVGDFGIENDGNGSEVTPISAVAGTPHHCSASAATKGCFTYDSKTGTFPQFAAYNAGTAVPFGAAERNQFFGPHFFNTDMTLQKAFALPHMGDQGKLEVGMTGFNLFNHPSFGLPNGLVDNGSPTFGYSLYAEGPPTSIYGSGVGGDPSVRIVEFTAKFIF